MPHSLAEAYFHIVFSTKDRLRHYIATQQEHHRKESFKDEFRRLLRGHNVEYDERYVWD